MKQIVKDLVAHFNGYQCLDDTFKSTYKNCEVGTYTDLPRIDDEEDEECSPEPSYFITFTRGETSCFERVTHEELAAINRAIVGAKMSHENRILEEIRYDLGLS